jgi:hypothetical protein
MLSVVMLSVILNVTYKTFVLSAIMLSVVRLNVVMLSVVAPQFGQSYKRNILLLVVSNARAVFTKLYFLQN